MRLKQIRYFFMLFLILSTGSCLREDDSDVHVTGFRLWQLPSHSDQVMNSYIMVTPNGHTVVFDGGYASEANYLFNILKTRNGNHVNAWFISHPHQDHVGALTEILTNPKYESLNIDVIYGSLNSEEDVLMYEPGNLQVTVNLNRAIKESGKRYAELQSGETIIIDYIGFEILGIKNPEITHNFINNSSVVIRATDYKDISVLFTGDLGVEGGEELLEDHKHRIESKYVQMAHHGNFGVSREFYEFVNPDYCLWPTPRWLWENNDGKGYNTGSNRTLIVRGWMDSLGVKGHFVMSEGFIEVFNFPADN
jgi:hypothetical protein